MEQLNVYFIAQKCHEANKAFCESLGDFSILPWDSEEPIMEELRNSMITGVRFNMENPDMTPEKNHEVWMETRINDGWVYGEVKDYDKKTHPCLVPYNQLPIQQRTKDYIFKSIVDHYVSTGTPK